MVEEDALLHGKALLVVASGKLEDVALELIAQEVSLNLSAHSLLEQVTAAR